MTTIQYDNPIIDAYVKNFERLSAEEQTVLLERLVQTTPHAAKEKTLKDFFGIWADDSSTENLAEKIRESRSFNRERKSL